MAGISILLLCPANIQTVRNFFKIILANRTLAVIPGPPLEKNPYIWGRNPDPAVWLVPVLYGKFKGKQYLS